MTSSKELNKLFHGLYDDVGDVTVFDRRPKLAHYTSMANVESILRNKEVWLSNPLLMNDYDEIRFGISRGIEAIKDCDELKSSLKSSLRRRKFYDYFEGYVAEYDNKYLLDTYIMCFSEHSGGDADGALSMWRGYGRDGKGAALIFDTQYLVEPLVDSPLTIGDVDYLPLDKRKGFLSDLGRRCARIIESINIATNQLHVPAYFLLERLKFFSLFTEHEGFREEREWRIVYQSEKDKSGVFKPVISYHNCDRGVEPKLKLSEAFIESVFPGSGIFDKLIDSVVIGPSASSQISQRSIQRMIKLLGYNNLAQRVFASSIPYRPL